MSDQTSTTASSAAEQFLASDTSSLAEYQAFRKSGDVPERFKPAETAESATAQDLPEANAESETESGAEESQEPKPQPKKLTAEGRIAQLTSQIEKLWDAEEPDTIKIAQLEATKDKIEQRAGLKRKTEPAPVTPAQIPANAKPTLDATDKDGNPLFSSFEDYVEALAEWKAGQKLDEFQHNEAAKQAQQAAQKTIDAARSRYDDFEDVVTPAADAIVNDPNVPMVVKEMLGGSDVFPDVVYLIGKDPKELASFLQMARTNPREALAKIFEYEQRAKGQTVAKAPEKKQTQAPKPPSPVGGGSSRVFDASDENSNLSNEDWQRKRNEERLRKFGRI